MDLLRDFFDAVIDGFGSRPGAWLSGLIIWIAASLLPALLFIPHVLILGASGGRRSVHAVFRFIELHLFALAAALLAAWCLLTAALSFIDRPYGDWQAAGWPGALAAGIHIVGLAVWVLIGIFALRWAALLAVRAYRPPSYE